MISTTRLPTASPSIEPMTRPSSALNSEERNSSRWSPKVIVVSWNRSWSCFTAGENDLFNGNSGGGAGTRCEAGGRAQSTPRLCPRGPRGCGVSCAFATTLDHNPPAAPRQPTSWPSPATFCKSPRFEHDCDAASSPWSPATSAMIPLYPLRFQPVLKRAIWGGRRLQSVLGKSLPPGDDYAESWEVVDRADQQSVVSVGPLAGMTLSDLVAGAWARKRCSAATIRKPVSRCC